MDNLYEYEVLLENGIAETWVPITKNSIKKPENIEKYLDKGILRKLKIPKFKVEFTDMVFPKNINNLNKTPIFICKYFYNFGKIVSKQEIAETRFKIIDYLELSLKEEYNILVFLVVADKNEFVFEIFNNENIESIDLETLKQNIETEFDKTK